MQNASKQFGAKDIGSFNKRFEKSLWKLTFLYVSVLFIILFLSSSVLYSFFSIKLGHRYRDFHPVVEGQIPFQNFPTPPTQEDLQGDLILSLIFVNGILLIGAGFLSYWLALVTLRPLKETFENQRAFLADASHELRTPLSILKIDIENKLSSPNLKREDIEGLKSNLEEVDRMSKLVSDLLTLSRLNDEKGVLNKEVKSINLNDFLQNIVDRLIPLGIEHKVSLKLSLPKQDITLHTNPDLINQSVTNLIKNGILYNKPSGSVSVSLSKDPKFVLIKITDTGIGISENDLSKIFDRFYRTDKSRSRQTGGSGLGLSIADSSIKHLGGEISIASKVGEGTDVLLKIPLR